MNNTAKYVELTVSHRPLQHANMMFAVVGLGLTIAMSLALGVSLIDVGLGVLVAGGLGFSLGFLLPFAANAVGKIDWYFRHFLEVSQFLGAATTVLGVAMFVGLPAAALIVIGPMLVTMPTFAAFRAWAIRHYA